MKILAVGDMHLGRTPSRLPDELRSQARKLGPVGAWRRTVQAAIDRSVTAVLLAGDLVDREDDFFEAYRELAAGVRRLMEKGIKVIAVAGNHDVKVLPRLAQQIPEFRLLGEGGEWEHCTIAAAGESITLWGWSFPQARVAHSPLANARFARQPGINLGLLHCDLGASDSPYAPVRRLELEQAGLDGWLLGHIHKPDALAAPSPNGYLGSLTGLHRGETGQRGPWLMTIANGRISTMEHLPLAPLRWERLPVALDGLEAPEDAVGRISQELAELDGRMGQAAAVGLQVCFTGRSGLGAKAEAILQNEHRGWFPAQASDRRYFIESILVATRPEIDLARLAERQDPLGLLAQRLLLLEQPQGHAQRDQLIALAQERLNRQWQAPRWGDLRQTASAHQRLRQDSQWLAPRRGDLHPSRADTAEPTSSVGNAHRPRGDSQPPGPDAVEWLRRAGFRALDELLAQEAEQG